jgi:hypothetical protein
VPLDKFEVPKGVFENLLNAAFNPTDELKNITIYFKSRRAGKSDGFSFNPSNGMPRGKRSNAEENDGVHFFALGSLVSNFDFVESIFGNSGSPNLAQNDTALDPESWTGQTGCIVIAPYLKTLTKKIGITSL